VANCEAKLKLNADCIGVIGVVGVADGPGNFAQHLVKALYPELFTEENLRTQYSYFGGGRLEKTALSPTRLY
jgi:hypothetical protein